jgi:hypothetical protein
MISPIDLAISQLEDLRQSLAGLELDLASAREEREKMGKVLIACEESQAVTKEMRALGVEAYSCDIEPCSGGHPEWHIQGDVAPLLEQDWDMIIAFPPCTHLAVSGAAWFEQKRKDGRQQQGIDFFMLFANANCQRIAIENPVGIMSSIWRKPDQIIQPWMFGHPESKATCFWLKGLPKLTETNNVKSVFDSLPKNQQQRLHYLPPSKDRGHLRSKTFEGIANAMADQWGVAERRKLRLKMNPSNLIEFEKEDLLRRSETEVLDQNEMANLVCDQRDRYREALERIKQVSFRMGWYMEVDTITREALKENP